MQLKRAETYNAKGGTVLKKIAILSVLCLIMVSYINCQSSSGLSNSLGLTLDQQGLLPHIPSPPPADDRLPTPQLELMFNQITKFTMWDGTKGYNIHFRLVNASSYRNSWFEPLDSLSLCGLDQVHGAAFQGRGKTVLILKDGETGAVIEKECSVYDFPGALTEPQVTFRELSQVPRSIYLVIRDRTVKESGVRSRTFKLSNLPVVDID